MAEKVKSDIDYQIGIKWKKLVAELDETFGGGLDLQSVIFLIGVQELGQGYQKFSKRQKLELMHIGICTVLEPYGFYKLIGRDKENWPHFEFVEELPPLSDAQQRHLMKEAIMNYFEAEKASATEPIQIREALRYFNEEKASDSSQEEE
ncbi:MAG TPA: hypothetical protein VL021_08115 [Brumimicrobium sp.]|nr:hypothetical protein [Brumimicrobium sp.]